MTKTFKREDVLRHKFLSERFIYVRINTGDTTTFVSWDNVFDSLKETSEGGRIVMKGSKAERMENQIQLMRKILQVGEGDPFFPNRITEREVVRSRNW